MIPARRTRYKSEMKRRLTRVRSVSAHALARPPDVGLAALDQYLYAVDARLPLAFPALAALERERSPFPAPRRLAIMLHRTWGGLGSPSRRSLLSTVMTVGEGSIGLPQTPVARYTYGLRTIATIVC